MSRIAVIPGDGIGKEVIYPSVAFSFPSEGDSNSVNLGLAPRRSEERLWRRFSEGVCESLIPRRI